MATESAMYAKVRDFVVSHWKASVPLTKHDSGPQARGKGITLAFGGISVEPDIYGIVVSNSTELPILGEGKLRMGGHVGTHAFAQALAYRNLGMLSFLFFPESEFTPSTKRTFAAMCAQAGIGLLSVPAGKKPIDPKRDVVVELAGGDPKQVVAAIEDTLTEIKGVGQRHLAHIYPSSLRDLLHLFRARSMDRADLERRYRERWRSFAGVFRERPYDPMVARKVASGAAEVKRQYFDKLVGGLLALDLISPTSNGFQMTDFGEHLRSVTERGELFTTTVSAHVRRLFAFAVMREFEDIVLLMLRTLEAAGQPVSTRAYCRGLSCGESSWRLSWRTDARGRTRCPSCNTKMVEPGFWLRVHEQSGDSGRFVSYPFLKFARAVGLFESRPPQGWRAQFPAVPTHRPSGASIGWKYLWRGEALGG